MVNLVNIDKLDYQVASFVKTDAQLASVALSPSTHSTTLRAGYAQDKLQSVFNT